MKDETKRYKSPLRWPGGKTRMLDRILPLMPKHEVYCEPFAGGIAVLRAKKPCGLEVINDINGDLVALYRNLRHHMPTLLDEIQFVLNSHKELKDFIAQPGLTEIQRAARFLMRNKLSFNGGGKSFSAKNASVSRSHTLEIVRELNERLDRVVVEQLPYDECIRKYDSKQTWHFIDSPYLDAQPGAYRGWTREEILGLRKVIDGIEGQWMVTIDDSQFNRETFKGFKIRGYKVQNGCVAKKGGQKFGELIITPP